MSATEFPAAWQVLGELHGPPGWNWRTDAMPRNHRPEVLVAKAAKDPGGQLLACLVRQTTACRPLRWAKKGRLNLWDLDDSEIR